MSFELGKMYYFDEFEKFTTDDVVDGGFSPSEHMLYVGTGYDTISITYFACNLSPDAYVKEIKSVCTSYATRLNCHKKIKLMITDYSIVPRTREHRNYWYLCETGIGIRF